MVRIPQCSIVVPPRLHPRLSKVGTRLALLKLGGGGIQCAPDRYQSLYHEWRVPVAFQSDEISKGDCPYTPAFSCLKLKATYKN